MNGIIHLDTLYLIVKYPRLDVFQKWYQPVQHLDYRLLKEGIASGEFVIKGGASCYKVSVWQHDARIFLTDQVDEKVGEGKGSGVWVQLGPKFLTHHIYHLQTAVKELLASIGIEGDYPIKINRCDIAMDLFGVEMKEQDLELWKNGWVGRSKVSGLFFNSRTGDLETINIGSRKSPVVLRVYDKVAQAIKEGDILYWLDIWQGFNGAVTRIEWEIKPSDGNFQKGLQDFSQFNGFVIRETLIYLVQKWGRLCIPNPNDSNNRRWKEAPLWEAVSALAAEFSEGVDYIVSRYGKEFHGISDAYIKFLSGAISGGMARFSFEEPNMVNLLKGLAESGRTLGDLQKEAKQKAAIYKNL